MILGRSNINFSNILEIIKRMKNVRFCALKKCTKILVLGKIFDLAGLKPILMCPLTHEEQARKKFFSVLNMRKQFLARKCIRQPQNAISTFS